MHLGRIAVLAVLLLTLPASGVAQNTPELQRSFSTQLFEPAIGLDRYFTVEGPRVMDHLAFGVGMMWNYQHKPLVLYRVTSQGSSTPGFDLDAADAVDVVSSQMTADVVGMFGLHFKWLRMQVGLGLPINVLLTGKQIDASGAETGEDLSATGVGDLRLQLKAMFFDDLAGFSLALSNIVTFPTGKDDAFGGDPNLTYHPIAVLGYEIGDFAAAVNIGGVIRECTTFFSSEVCSQLSYGVGAGYKVHPRVALLGELAGRAGFNTRSGCSFDPARGETVCDGTSNTDLDAFPLELDAGARVNVVNGLDITAGGGVGLIKAIGSPQFRVMVGLQWAPDFRDADDDGVYDHEDKCPTQAEDKDGFNDADGCPEPDNDGDLIPDAQDKCPNEKEDKDTFQDTDGCPEPDNDGDGILDLKDSCPFKPETRNGFQDEDGCPDVPDSDHDGVPDTKDKCPEEEEDRDNFEDLDGCPDPDNDGDGVPDNFDDCPLEAEDMDGFKDADGCPDPDNDNDGVLDAKDRCKGKPETINGYRDEDGCPDRGRSHVIVKDNKIVITKRVYFATGKAVIKRRSHGILKEVALTLIANPQIKKLRVEGHTDSRGKAERNKELSDKRARAVRAFLIGRGVDGDRMVAVGYGSERPIATNKTRRGRKKNRRVEFVILATGARSPASKVPQAEPTE